MADKVWKCPYELNLSILVLKNDEHSAFLRPRYNLFHQMIVDGKKKHFLKKCCGLCPERESLVRFSLSTPYVQQE